MKAATNNKVLYPIVKSIGAAGNKFYIKLAKIANKARYAKGKQGSELLQSLAKKAGFEVKNGGKHILVYNGKKLVTQIPHSARGNFTNKGIMEEAGF